MIGAIIALIWVVSNLVLRLLGSTSRQPNDNIEKSGGFVLMWVLALLLVGVALLLSPSWWPLSVAFGLVAMMLVVPWALASNTSIVKGWVRSTHFLGRLADWTFGRDAQGGAILAAAVAYRQQVTPREKDATYIRRRFEKLNELRGASAVALVVHRQHELSSAELASWMDFQRFVDWRVTPPVARAMVGEWMASSALARGNVARALEAAELVDSSILTRGEREASKAGISARDLIDASARGELDTVLCRGGTRPFAQSATLRVIALAARMLIDRPTLSAPAMRGLRRRLKLWSRLVPKPSGFGRLIAAALDEQSAPDPSGSVPGPVASDPLTAAVDAHLNFITDTATRAPGEAQLHAFGLAWERVLYRDEVKSSLLERAKALGVLRPERTLAAVEESVAEALAMALSGGTRTGPLPDEESVLLRLARENAAEKPMAALEMMVGAVAMRVDAESDLPIIDEYEELLRLYAAYRAVAGIGPQARSEAFQTVANPITNWGIRFWNDRRQFSLANAMFRFIAYEAMVVGDEEFVGISLSNLACRG